MIEVIISALIGWLIATYIPIPKSIEKLFHYIVILLLLIAGIIFGIYLIEILNKLYHKPFDTFNLIIGLIISLFTIALTISSFYLARRYHKWIKKI